MAKYNSVVYNQTTYGQKSRLAFSVTPFTAVALDYGVVQLDWSSPVGGYSAFRLLRNQDAFSETQEDGIVLFEEFNIDVDSEGSPITTGVVSLSSLQDSSDLGVPTLVNGKYAYYTIWLLKSSDRVWYPAGQTYVLAPNPHPTYAPDGTTFKTTHQKFLDLIPRVYSSGSYAPIDEPNLNSDLSIFLKGFSFTVDEFLSELDSLMPNHQESKTSPEILAVKANQLGLVKEPLLSLRNQKKMVRDALYVYSTKGSAEALNTVAEDLTGYPIRVSVSPNLMLSAQDSTFYKGLGNWLAQGSCQLTLEDVNPVTNESLSIDRVYSAKVVASNSSAKITNGVDAPVTKGVPVTGGVEYSFSLYTQMGSSTGTLTTSISWYDFTGTLISTSTGSGNSVTTTWDSFTQTATAPDDAVYAALGIAFASGTYYLDMLQFSTSDVTDYNEARCIQVFLDPYKANYLYNPSFEASNGAWSFSGGSTPSLQTLATDPHILVGTKVLQATAGAFTAQSSTSAGDVPTGNYLAFSIYGKTTAASESITLGISAVDTLTVNTYSVLSNVVTLSLRESHPIEVGDQVVVSGVATAVNGTFTVTAVTGNNVSYAKTTANVDPTASTGTVSVTLSSSSTAVFTEDWSRQQVNLFIPSSYLATETVVSVSMSATLTDTTWLDSAQLEANYKATDYFDGDYGTERDALWSSTVHNSPSYIYPNKIVNVSRLTAEIEKYIPFNSPWIITSYSGTEASGIS